MEYYHYEEKMEIQGKLHYYKKTKTNFFTSSFSYSIIHYGQKSLQLTSFSSINHPSVQQKQKIQKNNTIV